MPNIRIFVAVLLAALAVTARGSGGPPTGARSPEVQKAEQLIHAKKWDEAIQVLEKAAQRESTNADVYNWLGYAERNRGNTDAAFAHYEKALQLDPKHRGAHEYVGEAYLLVGKPDKAKEHLAALRNICGTRCEEYKDLEKEIASYERRQASAAPAQ